MMRAGRVAVAILITSNWAAPSYGGPRHDDRPPLVINVENHADVPSDDLDKAFEFARRLYRWAGVEMAWSITREPGKPHAPKPQQSSITVVILGRGMTTLGTAASTLGVAPARPDGRERRVYAFAERVKVFATSNNLTLPRVLGHVIAHEIGHVLLPDAGHSSGGLMQANAPAGALTHDRMPPSFNAAQAATIRQQVASLRN
jgi:hypothetical protein